MKQQLIYEMTSQKQQKEKDSRIVYSVYWGEKVYT